MCGIAGFFGRSAEPQREAAQVARMVAQLSHRGPDDSGLWSDPSAGVALGHARLSILDLSPSGHQPMVSQCGRYVITFNGEVYNHRDLRRELERAGCGFRGRSDTEVVLEGISRWSLAGALGRFNGMFAFALWDKRDRTLTFARDRMGEKPLYYGRARRGVLFGSELKALRAHPDFVAEISRDALALYLRHSCIPAPYSIYRGVYKLPPGTMLTIVDPSANLPEPIPYWSAKEHAEGGAVRPFAGSESEAAERLDLLLRDAVKLRMEADVPLGAFLSGGIDSSTVVALMQSQSSAPVRTFTIGFHEDAYNEARDAKAVAERLGTAHTELYITQKQALDVIPRLPTLYDEPFADSSQIPTFLVSELARRQVTVSLSGDGGDELFGGYNRYVWGRRVWNKVKLLPPAARGLASSALTALSPGGWDSLFGVLGPVMPQWVRQRTPGDKLQKLAELLGADSQEALYQGLVSSWKEPARVALGSKEPPTRLSDRGEGAGLPGFIERMAYLDAVSYLPDDILVKLDRASMGVSLEARVPFLDHRVVEFAWSLPLAMKIRRGTGKWLLRQVLYRYLPAKFVERPKMGFAVPLDSWLRGPLRDWAEELLSDRRLRLEGYFDADAVRQKWREHLSLKRNWQGQIWSVLMFQSWLESERRP